MVFRDAHARELVALAREVREMDRSAIEDRGFPGLVLMELAGAGTARLILERLGQEPREALVLCGAGNNGGDGYVIARHLDDAGWRVRCVAFKDPWTLGGDAAHNHRVHVELGGEVHFMDAVADQLDGWLDSAEVIVDALFGTGLMRPIGGKPGELIERANARDAFKVAVDLPSGVETDTGRELGSVFQADLTATFAVAKVGLHQEPGRSRAGEVQVVNIAMPRSVVESVGAAARILDEQAAARLLPPRPVDGHKGTFGHVGLVAGFTGKEGAAVLAGLGALRAGVGLATWNRPGAPEGIARPPELMTHDLAEGLDARSDVLVVGPGLGVDGPAQAALEHAVASGRRLVLDADALNLIASGRAEPPAGSVLTPHPTEAARLLGRSTPEVQADRGAAARDLASRYDCVIVLKGAGSVVAAPDEPLVIVGEGDATLATGGTGDVLAGIIGALIAQGLTAYDAAQLGIWLHGRAGANVGLARACRGGLATEVADEVPGVIDDLAKGWPLLT